MADTANSNAVGDDLQVKDLSMQALQKLLIEVLDERVGEPIRRVCSQQAELVARIDHVLICNCLEKSGGRSKRASHLSASFNMQPSILEGSEVKKCAEKMLSPCTSSEADATGELSPSRLFESPCYVKETPEPPKQKEERKISNHLHRVDSTTSIRTSDRTHVSRVSHSAHHHHHHRRIMPNVDQLIIDDILGSTAFSDYISTDSNGVATRSRSPSEISSRGSPGTDERKRAERIAARDFATVAARFNTRSAATLGTRSENGENGREFSSIFGAQNSLGTKSSMRSSSIVENTTSVKKNMDTLRKERETHLLHTLENERNSFIAPVSALMTTLYSVPVWLLSFAGVLPFRIGMKSTCYYYATKVALASIFVCSIVLLSTDWDIPLCRTLHSNAACYSICAVFALMALHMSKLENLLGPKARPLAAVAHRYDFLDAWMSMSAWHFLKVVVLWLIAGLSRTVALADHLNSLEDPSSVVRWRGIAHIVFFWILTGSFSSLTYCHLHIVVGLEMTIDDFFSRFIETADATEGIVEWNLIQALLRRAAHTIEPCMLALQTCGFATLVLTGVEAVNESGPFAEGGAPAFFWAFSILVPVLMTLYAAFKSAAVTDKCIRVPSMLNSMIPSYESDDERAALSGIVNFIRNTDAGFYVKGVRLTTFMVLKIVYILGLLVLTMTLQFFKFSKR